MRSYGLSWSPQRAGFLLSSSDDKTVCLWDVNVERSAGSTLDASGIFAGHADVVEDVAWHTLHDSLFGSVGDDRMLMMCVGDVDGDDGVCCSVLR